MSREISRDSQDLFRLVAENIRDFAVFATDPEGRIVSWNPGVERLLGYKEEEWIGQHISIIFTPEDRAQGAVEQEKAFEHGEVTGAQEIRGVSRHHENTSATVISQRRPREVPLLVRSVKLS